MDKVDFEDVIYSALLTRESFGYMELSRAVDEIHKCSPNTFDKHLKKLVKKNLVKKLPPTKKDSRGRYCIDLDIKTLSINLTKIIDDKIVTLQEFFKVIRLNIIRLKRMSDEEMDNPKKVAPLFNRLVFSIVFVYKLLSALEFIQIAELAPEITKRKMRKINQTQINTLTRLLHEIKQARPLFHFDLCMYIETKML